MGERREIERGRETLGERVIENIPLRKESGGRGEREREEGEGGER